MPVAIESTLQKALSWLADQPLETLPGSLRLEWQESGLDSQKESDLLWRLLSSARTHHATFYWKDRDLSQEIIGIGEADVIHSLDNDKLKTAGLTCHERLSGMVTYQFDGESWQLGQTTASYFGGVQFSSRYTPVPEWMSFGAFRFVLPELEYRREGTSLQAALTVHFKEGERLSQLTALQSRLNLIFSGSESFFRRFLPQVSETPALSPNRAEWTDLFQRIKESMNQGSFQKVVLSRRCSLHLEKSCNPYDLLAHFQSTHLPGFLFCFEFELGNAFFGLSPELLFRKQDNHVFSEAVAGTRKRGKTSDEDLLFEQELMQSAKDRVEHQYVSEQIRKTFLKWCDTLDKDSAITILKTPKVQHLYQRFKGTLKPEITDIDILLGLHPTSAVCGLPKELLRSYISQVEPFERGWYAGAVGRIGLTQTVFSVAIRSGLLNKQNLHLYSGVGLVEDSNETAEWQEMDHKLALYLELIYGAQ